MIPRGLKNTDSTTKHQQIGTSSNQAWYSSLGVNKHAPRFTNRFVRYASMPTHARVYCFGFRVRVSTVVRLGSGSRVGCWPTWRSEIIFFTKAHIILIFLLNWMEQRFWSPPSQEALYTIVAAAPQKLCEIPNFPTELDLFLSSFDFCQESFCEKLSRLEKWNVSEIPLGDVMNKSQGCGIVDKENYWL